MAQADRERLVVLYISPLTLLMQAFLTPRLLNPVVTGGNLTHRFKLHNTLTTSSKTPGSLLGGGGGAATEPSALDTPVETPSATSALLRAPDSKAAFRFA